MELQSLQFFLAVAECQGISDAARMLGVTQSTLSRRMQALESEIGTPLFVRGNRGRRLTLTRSGVLLRNRAMEIVSLVERTEHELGATEDGIAGDVFIGAAECSAMSDVCQVMTAVHEENPRVIFHVRSGNGPNVIEWLDQGLVDFAVLIGTADLSRYERLQLPVRDYQSILMRTDHPLAALSAIRPEDLAGFPVIVPNGTIVRNDLSGWLGGSLGRLNVVGTTNLFQNAAMMVKAGYGCLVTLYDSLLDTDSDLCFRPLSPRIDVAVSIAWAPGRPLPPACELFLSAMRDSLER